MPWEVSDYCPKSINFVVDKPPPKFVDFNAYYSSSGGVVVCPTCNGTAIVSNFTEWVHLGGLDQNSMFNIDPLLDTSSLATDKRGIHVQDGSPALALGFHNFAYGPRTRTPTRTRTDKTTQPVAV
jgi:hypothetical protein